MEHEPTSQPEDGEPSLHMDVLLRALIERLRVGPPLSSDDNEVFEFVARELKSRQSDNGSSPADS
jgi:hypothetical protein